MNRKRPLLVLSLCLLLAACICHTLAESPNDGAKEKPSKLTYTFTDTGREATPIELTAADGTGLELKLYQAKAVVQGPLAFTELRLTFRNPEPRVREGRFRITLPDRAAISRFAMRIDDVWQEAEVVERQAARRAYEDFLHRRQDPALLEKSAGNEFMARIFPIPAGGEKELILSYSQELEAADTPYTINLQGLPEIADFEISLSTEQAGKTQTVLLKEKNYTPTGDFALEGLQSDGSLLSDGFLVTRIRPDLDATPDRPEDLLVMLDTSASRALGFAAQEKMLTSLLQKLGPLKHVTVAAFDQSVEQLYQGPSSGLHLTGLQERGAYGATDLGKALQWSTQKKGHTRLLLITDGITTAGETQLGEALKGSSLKRLDVILLGGIRDKDKMEVLVDGALAREGVVLSGDLPIAELAKRLQSSVTSGLDVSVAGAEWTWPETLDNVQPGAERLVYAKLSKDASAPFMIQLGSEKLELKVDPSEASPLLARSATVAQIARLESQLSETDDPEIQENLSDEIVSLSTTHRVLSSKTALLVLETDDDYKRFEIDRTALTDILMVGKNGLQLQNRKQVHLPKQPVAKSQGERDKDEHLKRRESPGDSVAAGADPLSADLSGERSDVNAPPPPPPPSPSPPEPAPTLNRVSSGQTRAPAIRAELDEEAEMPVLEVARPQEAGRHLEPEEKVQERPSPLTGKFAEIDALLKAGKTTQALKLAQQWQKEEPGNVLALVALGDCLQSTGKLQQAARVFGSIIDLFPSRADLRRYAGSRLQSLGPEGLDLAVDSFRKAVEQRPDHVSSHRFLAYALARQGNYAQATEALEAGLSRSYPEGRFVSYDRILKDDLGLLTAAWLSKSPADKVEIFARLKKYDAKISKEPSLRFILTWETDANDVDFHIRDSQKGHAYYSQPKLESGGELYGDVTTGYGPECFAIPQIPSAYPYDLEIHYYSRGPMGYGMGQLEVLQHDGKGGLTFEERPYVVMVDGAYVSLGKVEDK
jgi:tetratricopeptide (TPR) repeat protein